MATGVDFEEQRANIEQGGDNLCVCETCITQKGTKRPHKRHITPGTHKMELIHTDVFGPVAVKGFDGSRFGVTFECDYSKLARLYLIKTKAEVTDCFMHFKRHYEHPERGEMVRRVRSDNGGEYISNKLQQYFVQEGIDWEPTVVHTPQMNGAAERLGRTIWNKAAPLLKYASLDLKFWPEALRYAAYLYMRSPHSAIKMTPWEAWYGTKPAVGHVRTFGSVIYYSNPKARPKKLEDKTCRGILVGFEGDTVCRILNANGRVVRGASVRTIERMLWDRDSLQEQSQTVSASAPQTLPIASPDNSRLEMPISIALPKTVVKRKRPVAEDWFITEPLESSAASWTTQTVPLTQTQAAPLGQARAAHLDQARTIAQGAVRPLTPAPDSSALSSPPGTTPTVSPQFWLNNRSPTRSPPGAPNYWDRLWDFPSPDPLANQLRASAIKRESPPSIPIERVNYDFSRAMTYARSVSSPDLSNNAFWPDEPPPRDSPPHRAAKRPHFWNHELDSDYEANVDPDDLYYASDVVAPQDEVGVPDYNSPTEQEEEYQEWEYVHHRELREDTPLSEGTAALDEGNVPATPAAHPELRYESSPDPLALVLIPSYLVSTEEYTLLAFLSQADPCELFEPRTLQEAMASPQWRMWEAAIKEEYNSLVENMTWTMSDVPANRSSLTGKWVFKVKRGAEGQILRYKARWVVRGFEQKEGVDFHETFASVVKPMSYKAIFAMAAAYDWEIEQMDVKTAFLYGDIDTEIYMELPSGCGVSGTCRLNKALYGLKQSPRVWYNTLASFLAEQGFESLDADSSVFYREGTIIAIYVDDLLIVGESMPDIQTIKDSLSARFYMTDLGPCHYYLGMEVIRDRLRRTLQLSQTAYLNKVLDDFGMQDCASVKTPMETSLRLMPAGTEYQAEASLRRAYQSAVGSLMYAMLGTRPDLAYAVSVVSRFASNPTEAHMNAVKRIFRYIKGTVGFGLIFRGTIGPLTGYTDSDWAGDADTRRSTSGYVFHIGSAAISWSSKRQPTVSLSSCEAEYIGQTNATKEAIWLRGFLRQIHPDLDQGPGATIIYGDNQGAIALAKNPQFHARTKHIDIQHHFVREKVAEGHVDLQYISTSEQVADGLTKALCRDKFEAFRKAVGVE
jgi:hypothetical protein